MLNVIDRQILSAVQFPKARIHSLLKGLNRHGASSGVTIARCHQVKVTQKSLLGPKGQIFFESDRRFTSRG